MITLSFFEHSFLRSVFSAELIDYEGHPQGRSSSPNPLEVIGGITDWLFQNPAKDSDKESSKTSKDRTERRKEQLSLHKLKFTKAFHQELEGPYP